jgi:hypothetical protein
MEDIPMNLTAFSRKEILMKEAPAVARTAMVERTAMMVEITPKTTEIKPKVLPIITPITMMKKDMKTTKEKR